MDNKPSTPNPCPCPNSVLACSSKQKSGLRIGRYRPCTISSLLCGLCRLISFGYPSHRLMWCYTTQRHQRSGQTRAGMIRIVYAAVHSTHKPQYHPLFLRIPHSCWRYFTAALLSLTVTDVKFNFYCQPPLNIVFFLSPFYFGVPFTSRSLGESYRNG